MLKLVADCLGWFDNFGWITLFCVRVPVWIRFFRILLSIVSYLKIKTKTMISVGLKDTFSLALYLQKCLIVFKFTRVKWRSRLWNTTLYGAIFCKNQNSMVEFTFLKKDCSVLMLYLRQRERQTETESVVLGILCFGKSLRVCPEYRMDFSNSDQDQCL